MTPDERDRLEEKVDKLLDRVEDLENEREAIKELPYRVGELYGAVETLTKIVNARFDGVDEGISGLWLKVGATIFVPLITVLVGAYVALKTGVAP